MSININFKKTDEEAIMPTYGSEYAAGADLYAIVRSPHGILVRPHETVFIDTGIAVEIPEGYVGLVYSRSGIACKRALSLANSVGVIDSDYRSSIKIALLNHSDEPQVVNSRERIAQFIVQPIEQINFNEVDELNETVRGEGGFGSTGN